MDREQYTSLYPPHQRQHIQSILVDTILGMHEVLPGQRANDSLSQRYKVGMERHARSIANAR